MKEHCTCGTHAEPSTCGCGGHHHDHAEHADGGCGCGGNCGCGGHHHHHDHDHAEGGCGCGGHHHHNHDHAQEEDELNAPEKVIVNTPATPEQLDFLRAFDKIAPLPIAKYLVKSSVEHSFENVALRDVCLRSGEDSIALIKETATFLQGLEASNLIAIDYETYLDDAAYEHYFTSASYLLLQETVAQGQNQQNFLGDITTIEKGCIGMTAWGKEQLTANRAEN